MPLRCTRCLDDGVVENYGGPMGPCDCAYGVSLAQSDIAALRGRERLIWMLIEQAGGRVAISRSVMQRFDSVRATLTNWTEFESGAAVYSTREKVTNR